MSAEIDLKTLTTQIVAVYAGNHSLAAGDVAGLISTVYGALAKIDGGSELAAAPALVPAVTIRKSVTPEAIICLECGRKLQMMKRHLHTDHDLTIDEYRAKWGLPHDYPVVAPNYAAKRSQLAKDIGLGRKTGAKTPRKKLKLS